MPDPATQQHLGQLAVDRGLITADELAKAIGEMETRRAAGSRIPLGELMVAMGFITRNQLDYLLESQGGKKAPSQQIAGYELIRKLGEGGMGGVFLARQVSADRLVALKVLKRSLGRDSGYVERFRREARLAAMLDHPNVVRAIEVSESGGFHFMAMEYIEGRSLRDLVPEGGALPEALAVEFVRQAARGLEHAHQHGIVHRDIKPDNILIDGKGVAKLADLGLAKEADVGTRLTQTGMVIGTADYMSPEQISGDANVDIRSDIYSLGATLYHLVTGRPPFSGPNPLVVLNKHLTEQAPWPQDLNPEVSKGCCLLILRMMAKRPDDRHQGPTELLADLDLVASGKEPKSALLAPGKSSLGLAGAVPVTPHEVTRPLRVRPAKATRPVPEAPVRRRPAATVKGRVAVSVPWLIGASVALLAIGLMVGLLVRLCAGEKNAPGEADLGKRYADAKAYWQSYPTDYAGAIRRFREISAAAGNTEWKAKADEMITEVMVTELEDARRGGRNRPPTLDRLGRGPSPEPDNFRRPPVQTPAPPPAGGGLKPGLKVEYYLLAEADRADFLPAERRRKPSAERIDAQVNFPLTEGQFGSSGLTQRFCTVWSGSVRIANAGSYKFYLNSDDGSRLSVDGRVVVDNGGEHTVQEKDGAADLTAGDHAITVEYFQNTGPAGCVLSWEPPGGKKEVVPAEVLFHK